MKHDTTKKAPGRIVPARKQTRPLHEPAFPVERPGPAMAGVLVAALAGIVVLPIALVLGSGIWAALGYALAAQVVALLSVIGWALALGRTGPGMAPGAPVVQPDGPVPETGRDGLTDAFLARWDVMSAKTPGIGQDRAIALVAQRGPLVERLAQRLAEDGCEVHISDGVEEMLEAIAAAPDRWRAVIVDLDDGRDLAEPVDSLVIFREQAPQVPVLALSASVASDDLGTERLALCDATLRKPVMRLSLLRGLEAANRNNKLWQQRLAELAAE